MQASTFTFKDHAGVEIFVRKWAVDSGVQPKEHSARYEHVAQTLTDAGYIVYADDHRGHKGTAKDLDKAGQLGPGGWTGTVKAIHNLTEKIKEENSRNLPIFYLGHSWGSYMGQDLMQEWGDDYDGVILSGTNGKVPGIGVLGAIGKLITKIKGENTPAKMIDKLAFGPFNKPFKPNRTTHDWLTTDDEEVDKYIEDPWCGFILPNGFFLEMVKGFKKIWNPSNEAKIPKELPVYLFTGGNDPTNNMGKGLLVLYDRYENLGIKDLSKKIYPGDRHETLNEKDKEQVKQDIIDWLDDHV